jgi:hypothetical protein
VSKMFRSNLSSIFVDIAYEQYWAGITSQPSSCCFSMANMADFLLLLANNSIPAKRMSPDPFALIPNPMHSGIGLIWLVILYERAKCTFFDNPNPYPSTTSLIVGNQCQMSRRGVLLVF